MITKIELTNFMSHAHTVIEPAAGLTVLVGANNVGKSAVVAALEILCHNDNSTYVMRHGEKQCSVKVETDDGHAIEWRRKTSPSYVIDGQTFDRLGTGGIPDELHQALKLPLVDAGSDAEFDVHFGTQKSPIFLLGNSGPKAARFFASSSDANDLVAIQKRHKDKLAEAQREKGRLEEDSRALHAQLELLEPTVELDRRLELIEKQHADLLQRDARLAEAIVRAQAMGRQSRELARHRARAEALGELAAPPELADTRPLANLIESLRAAQRSLESSRAKAAVISALPTPPVFDDVVPLERLIADITTVSAHFTAAEVERRSLAALTAPPDLASEMPLELIATSLARAEDDVRRWSLMLNAAGELSSPPVAADVRPIAECVAQLRRSIAQWTDCQQEYSEAERTLAAVASELRAKATGASCSVCGSPLDPDRVVARAAAGLGAHDHG